MRARRRSDPAKDITHLLDLLAWARGVLRAVQRALDPRTNPRFAGVVRRRGGRRAGRGGRPGEARP
jgi:hypothetical protein